MMQTMRQLQMRVSEAARVLLWTCWEGKTATTAAANSASTQDAPPKEAPADTVWKRRGPALATVVSTYLELHERSLEIILELAQGPLSKVTAAPGLAAAMMVADCPSLSAQSFSTWYRCGS